MTSRVHVDTNSHEWGRIVSDGTWIGTLESEHSLIHVDSIQTTIIVPNSDINHKE